jgi:hypothetical protein
MFLSIIGSEVLTDILVLGYSKAWMKKQTIVKGKCNCPLLVYDQKVRIVSYAHIVLLGW